MMKRIISLVIFLIIGHSLTAQTILFMAGLEKDLSADKQAEIIKKALPNHKVITFKKNEVNKIINYSMKDTNSVIVLFSAACKNSYEIIISTLCDVWIVEPHNSYGKQIREAIKIGFPKKQIILGPKPIRGFGISKGCRNTPNNLDHFQSLKYVSNFLK